MKREFNNVIMIPYAPSLQKIKIKNFKKYQIAFRYSNTIKNSLSQFRTGTDKGGVYCIPCNDCNKKYFGETGRDLKKRIYEHKGDIRRGNEKSSIFNHVSEGHKVDFDSTQFIFRSNSYVNRRIVESILIKKSPNFNISEGQYQIGEFPLEVISHRLLSHIKIPESNK